jgi:hypothetical protein
MIRLFGGWRPYREAPARLVEEQRCVWIAKVKAENEKIRRHNAEKEKAKRNLG